MIKYFAYGSNLSIGRMLNRGVNFANLQSGTLFGYKFVINKRSQKDPKIGFASIIKDDSSVVEGIVYDVSDLSKLDKHEGFPKHYTKEVVSVNTKDGIVEAVVYIAVPDWVSDGLISTEDYKSKILEGKEYLSKEYYDKLVNEIKTF